MLLRGKYNVLINVTWDCFDQSNFYVSRINIIEWNNIQLLHLKITPEMFRNNNFVNKDGQKISFGRIHQNVGLVE
jgi:hypothetical protein